MGKGCVFVIPGDINTLTGGYIYDRKVISELRNAGITVDLISLQGNFPNPTADDQRLAKQSLANLEGDVPVIIDGLALGALDADTVSAIAAPIIALIHHPLADEGGLDEESKDKLFESEFRNLQQVKKVLVPSSNTAELLISKYAVDEKLISIATPGFDKPQTVSNPSSPPLILSVGTHTHRKGHDVLLQSLSKITDLSWQAVIAGKVIDEDYSKTLISLRKQLGLQSRLEIMGELDQQQLAKLYSKATVFALATRHEGYGMVFAEAMGYGLPIVSCDAGAVKQTVGNGAAITVNPDSPESFAKALRTVLEDKETYQQMSQQALLQVANLAGWDKTASYFIEALASLGGSE